jgi:hypothetical protein
MGPPSFHLIIPADDKMALMDEKVVRLVATLSPLPAILVWDVVNDQISKNTIQLADLASDEEWGKYDLIRCLAAGNPEHPPVQEAKALIDMMLEVLEPAQVE